jgi:hypothetical protein
MLFSQALDLEGDEELSGDASSTQHDLPRRGKFLADQLFNPLAAKSLFF